MRLLLDTQSILWHLSGERTLSTDATEAMEAADDILLSVVSYAEIGIKVSVGKLEVPNDLQEQVAATGVRTLALTAVHGLKVSRLPMHHRDPFDRLLIAQALVEGLTVVTPDRRFSDYEVAVVEAV